jgi:hypothetical protein
LQSESAKSETRSLRERASKYYCRIEEYPGDEFPSSPLLEFMCRPSLATFLRFSADKFRPVKNSGTPGKTQHRKTNKQKVRGKNYVDSNRK